MARSPTTSADPIAAIRDAAFVTQNLPLARFLQNGSARLEEGGPLF